MKTSSISGILMKIYFAGPNVFHPKAREMELLITDYCQTLGVTPLIPGDSGINWANPDLQTIARQIFAINRDYIINCDAVIANTTPFRGACIDDGTAWEVGFAVALNKPVVTYASGSAKTGETIETFSGVSSEYEQPRRDCDGYIIEEFGFQSNLMIACSTERHFHSTSIWHESIIVAVAEPIHYLLAKRLTSSRS